MYDANALNEMAAAQPQDITLLPNRTDVLESGKGQRQVLPLFLMGIGVLLRTVQYLSNRSLWLDESSLALNILHRTPRDLLKPLDTSQGAPPAFLWLEKFAVATFGPSEFSLRFFPFLFGVLSVFVFYAVAKRWLRSSAMTVALFFFATSGALIYYSAEVKQYSTDVLFALLLYWVASFLGSRSVSLRGGIALGVVGAVAVWFSHPAVFVFAGIALTLFFEHLGSDRRTAAKVIVASLIAVASFGALYWISLRSLIGNKNLQVEHWASFAPLPVTAEGLAWYYNSFLALFNRPVGMGGAAAVASFILLIGCAHLYREHPQRLSLLLSPLLVAVVASGLHCYPIAPLPGSFWPGGRFLLFTVPALLLMLGEGTEQLCVALKPHVQWPRLVVLTFLAVVPVMSAARMLVHPITAEEMRPVLSYIQAHQQPGDIVYVYYGAEPAFEYYVETGRFRPAGPLVTGVESRENWQGYERDLNVLRGKERAWIVLSHDWTGNGADEKLLISHYLEEFGTRIDSFAAPGALTYLYYFPPKHVIVKAGNARSGGRSSSSATPGVSAIN